MDLVDWAFRARAVMGRDEVRFLGECARDAPDGQFVELGPFMGGSTIMIAAAANERDLPFTTIDNFSYARYGGSSPAIIRNNLQRAGIETLPRIIDGLSANVPGDIDSVAFLFIDTDHRAVVLNKELDAWLPLIIEGGVIALHDYACPERFPEMIEVIDERLTDSDEWEFVGLVNHLVAFRRV